MNRAVMTVLACLALCGAARAETGEERAACTPDVWRLCASAIPDAGAITHCLRQARPQLSSACRTVMDGSAKPVRSVASNRR